MERKGLVAAALAAVALIAGSVVPAAAGAAAPLDAHGSAEQVYATGLTPGARVELLGLRARVRQVRRAGSLGGVLFRGVRPGPGYRLRVPAAHLTSGPLTVFGNGSAPPDTSFYGQSIPASGYGYMTMRDGVKLAYTVHPPLNPVGGPPYPTVIEYAGYGYADPKGPQNGLSIIANAMGFAVVDVNMRGTGCSGGAYDFFEPLQSLDGYDVVETVAHQPWVKDHKVGMFGISYGGISQLFVAATQPPDLAAITPQSTIDSTITTLYPGGVLNTGFAVAWALERVHDALPASATGGQRYAYDRIQGGDAECAANQVLHTEAADLRTKIRQNDHYVPAVADPLDPITFVNRIKVPVFMACQLTDEQVGAHCPDLAEHMTGTNRKWFTFTNGTHVDSLDPDTVQRMYDFLMLYVAHEPPIVNAAVVNAAGPAIYNQAMNINGQTLPPDPIQLQPTYAGALAAFESLPSVRVLFDNGAGGVQPGFPMPAFEASWPSFPVPGTTARTWYMQPGGGLAATRPATRELDGFTWNAKARPLTDFTGDSAAGQNGLWTATPVYDWRPPPPGSAVSYVSAPLPADTTVVGAGAVHLWVRSSRPAVDLQATVSEVRPDGKETFVQGGWVRGDMRALDRAKSTLLEPVLSLRAEDQRPLPATRFTPVTIPLYYEGHAYRAGSRLRVTVSAPNGDQPIWSFSVTRPAGAATAAVAVELAPRAASDITLPVVGGVAVTPKLPPCPGLRGEPCRDYVPYVNRTVAR